MRVRELRHLAEFLDDLLASDIGVMTRGGGSPECTQYARGVFVAL